MSQIQETVEVEVPVSVAYNQWTQFESFPQFMSGVESVTQIDDTRTHWVTNIAGVEREFDAEIIEQDPDRRIAWCSIGDEVRHAGEVRFEPVHESATRVQIAMDWEPSGLVEKVGSAVNVDERQVRRDAERFKDFIEARGHETGAWRGEVDGGISN